MNFCVWGECRESQNIICLQPMEPSWSLFLLQKVTSRYGEALNAGVIEAPANRLSPQKQPCCLARSLQTRPQLTGSSTNLVTTNRLVSCLATRVETASTFQAASGAAVLFNPILLKAEGQVPQSRSQEILAT